MHETDPATPPGADALAAAIAFGIDLSLLEENLRKTPTERLRELTRMQELFERLHPAHRPVAVAPGLSQGATPSAPKAP